jgi:hypothetical protein
MQYLVLGVWHDPGSGNVATHSKTIELCFKEPEDEADMIIDDLCSTGIERGLLHEVFVFKSAQNYGTAPEQAAYWTADDGLFGEQEDEEEDEEGQGDQG